MSGSYSHKVKALPAASYKFHVILRETGLECCMLFVAL